MADEYHGEFGMVVETLREQGCGKVEHDSEMVVGFLVVSMNELPKGDALKGVSSLPRNLCLLSRHLEPAMA